MTRHSITGTITTIQLQRLIKELYEHSPKTKIRFRLKGKMWESRFLEIVHVTASDSVIVQDNKAEQMKHVSVADVVEFELETGFQEFHPAYQYKVEHT